MFIGIDQSYTETAVTILFSTTNYNTYSFKGKGSTKKDKLKYTQKHLKKTLTNAVDIYINKMKKSPKDILCFIEGGSFDSSEGQLFSLGQVSGMILGILNDLDIEYREIPPTQLKKFITGNGHANKKWIMKALKEKYNAIFRNDNKADSYVLALMAYKFKKKSYEIKYREEEEIIDRITNGTKKKAKPRYRRKKMEF